MVEQRRKARGRRGRKSRGGKTRHARPAAGREPMAPRRRVAARPQRVRRADRARVILPSDRWRSMRRVSGVSWTEQHTARVERVRREEAAADERFAEQPPRHGRKGRLVEFVEETAGAD